MYGKECLRTPQLGTKVIATRFDAVDVERLFLTTYGSIRNRLDINTTKRPFTTVNSATNARARAIWKTQFSLRFYGTIPLPD